jgi:hypothetical protein
MARGRTNGEIAEELGIGFSTAKSHVSQIIAKLGVTTREEAVHAWRDYRRALRMPRRAFAGFTHLALAKAAAGALAVVVAAVGLYSTVSLDKLRDATELLVPGQSERDPGSSGLDLQILEIEADAVDPRIRIAFVDSTGLVPAHDFDVGNAMVRGPGPTSHASFYQYPESTGELSTEVLFPALPPGSEWEFSVGSATVGGSPVAAPADGWSVPFTVPGWPADSITSSVSRSEPLGTWVVVIDEVAKSGDRFVVRAHFEGAELPPAVVRGQAPEPPWLTLELADGSFAALDWACMFQGPDRARIEVAFYGVTEWPARFHVEYRGGLFATSAAASMAAPHEERDLIARPPRAIASLMHASFDLTR